ncbi:NUDIX domain-containing protein [Shewanella algae]|uniref:NUDIX hydrolase n=1 Tax=Shewanella algae TaxID=38313 RepID=UPI001AAD2EBF|nr:NUDIX domain-containing protein [Shewanella algae]MBO2656033.1 NUDIX domain-containing protein [Shewanella algae]
MKKSAGIIIKNRSLLVLRSKGKNTFFAPGGKPDVGELSEDALVRELREELGVVITKDDFSFFNSYVAPASGNEDIELEMDVYIINSYEGKLKENSEIAELKWVNTYNINQVQVSSIFKTKVFPILVGRGLID